MAKAAKEIFKAPKKLYLLNPDYEGGHSAARNFVKTYMGVVPDAQVVGEAWPKLGTQDFTANLTAVMNSGADLMFTSFFQTDALTMIKQMIAMGANGKFAMAGIWHGTFAVIEKFNKDFYPMKTIGGGGYPFWAINSPESKEFVQKIKDKYNVYPEYAVMSYAFTKAMAAAIKKAGKLDTEKVIDALEGYVMDTPVGKVEIRACDHQAMWPNFVGLIGPVPGYDFYGTQNPQVYGAEAYRTCAEIAEVRGK
jgi:branched-chain amino acid transport system substrate-binding protein